MFYFITGIVVGAAFSPFWLVVFKNGKEFIQSKMEKQP